ncbi:hypothetical protein CPB84DRAFT_1771048, partial [Gymnopilus junonius]
NETPYRHSLIFGTLALAQDCHWRGTAPFCHGNCDVGYTTQRWDKHGEGTSVGQGIRFTVARHINSYC